MKVVLDTNIIFSAILFPSNEMIGMVDFLQHNHNVLVFDYIAEELIVNATLKKPGLVHLVHSFLDTIEIVQITPSLAANRIRMRDVKDQPILDAAIAADADIILTGDKDFTALEIESPRIMTPAEFMAEYM